jgi:hypothetical protein
VEEVEFDKEEEEPVKQKVVKDEALDKAINCDSD